MLIIYAHIATSMDNSLKMAGVLTNFQNELVRLVTYVMSRMFLEREKSRKFPKGLDRERKSIGDGGGSQQ